MPLLRLAEECLSGFRRKGPAQVDAPVHALFGIRSQPEGKGTGEDARVIWSTPVREGVLASELSAYLPGGVFLLGALVKSQESADNAKKWCAEAPASSRYRRTFAIIINTSAEASFDIQQVTIRSFQVKDSSSSEITDDASEKWTLELINAAAASSSSSSSASASSSSAEVSVEFADMVAFHSTFTDTVLLSLPSSNASATLHQQLEARLVSLQRTFADYDNSKDAQDIAWIIDPSPTSSAVPLPLLAHCEALTLMTAMDAFTASHQGEEDNAFAQRKKIVQGGIKKHQTGGGGNKAAASNESAPSVPIIPVPEYAVELSVLLRSTSSPPASVTHLLPSPMLSYSPSDSTLSVHISFSVLSYSHPQASLQQALSDLQQEYVKQCALFVTHAKTQVNEALLRSLDKQSGVQTLFLRSLQFQPSIYLDTTTMESSRILPFALSIPVVHSWVTPVPVADKSLQFDSSANADMMAWFPALPADEAVDAVHPALQENFRGFETGLKAQRQRLHTCFNLPTDMPLFRFTNALTFAPATQSASSSSGSLISPDAYGVHAPVTFITAPRLFNVHETLFRSQSSTVSTANYHTVSGRYGYYHYLQDKCADSGWGCAYRTLQSICSWFVLQGFSFNKPVPTIKDIQAILVKSGDKSKTFLGSRDWIGSTEVGLVLNHCYGIITKTIFVSSGSEVNSIARQLREHFDTQGTPIMIGGGVLAYGLLGIDYNEMTGDVKYLILDPHYTGSDSLTPILKGGWVGWKKSELFLQDHFYNFALPQRPKEAV